MLVSVIIPTIDRPKLVLRAIDSVLRQTHHEIEVIGRFLLYGNVFVECDLALLWVKHAKKPRVRDPKSGSRSY